MSDPLKRQAGGGHYKTMKIQPVEFAWANRLGFMEANVVKYVCRHAYKGGEMDVRKAIHYCQLILQLQYGKQHDARRKSKGKRKKTT